FQAEDGIRDKLVTGVQTCALPISLAWLPAIAVPLETKQSYECPPNHLEAMREWLPQVDRILIIGWRAAERHFLLELEGHLRSDRSEERRVGKECRCRG